MEVDAAALRAERAAIRTRLERYAVDEVLGQRTAGQAAAAARAGTAHISEIDELLNATVMCDPLAAVVNAADPVAAWDTLELADQRLFIGRLCTVTILPSGCRGWGFDPATIDIVPQHTLGHGTLPAGR